MILGSQQVNFLVVVVNFITEGFMDVLMVVVEKKGL